MLLLFLIVLFLLLILILAFFFSHLCLLFAQFKSYLFQMVALTKAIYKQNASAFMSWQVDRRNVVPGQARNQSA